MTPPRSRDLFVAWLAAVALAVAVAAGATSHLAVLRPNGWDNTQRILQVSLAELPPPPPEPQIELAPEPVPPAPVSVPQVEPEVIPQEPFVTVDLEPEPQPAEEVKGTPPEPEPIARKVEARPPPPKPKIKPKAVAAPKQKATPKPRPAPPRNLSRPASAISQPAPRYPSSARRAGVSGTAYVTVAIDARGKVQSTSISSSSGNKSLDNEALRAVRRWKFRPALSSSGQATASKARVPVVFQIR